MTQPVISYSLREILDGMKADIKATRDDVADLKTGSALRVAEEARAAAAAAAAGARRALWGAVASPIVAGLVVWWANRH